MNLALQPQAIVQAGLASTFYLLPSTCYYGYFRGKLFLTPSVVQ
ncbi:hypothetical protein DBT_2029 [Dissulfuribacter thermophilus]|uniref:Uncharacterized protein n=1 Tax=Dissulfuribacter thermophilus TaxID=1156395 RepID=A0A1B9F3H7_9BACT|nr:hypothetical protein DBT_2029 [Dissulfuribacter thermophilus]